MPLIDGWHEAGPSSIPPAVLNKISSVFCSPSQRCRQLTAALNLPFNVVSEPRLQEINFGSWDGKPWTSIAKAEIDAWLADPLHFCGHGGESFHDLITRLLDFLAEIKGEDIPLLITHSGILKALDFSRNYDEKFFWQHYQPLRVYFFNRPIAD